MALKRPKDAPAATATATGDTFLIDGTTGVRALAKAAVPLLDVSGRYTVLQSLLGTDAAGSGYRFYRANGVDYTELYKSAGGLAGTADALNFYSSTLTAIGHSFGRDGTFAALAGILSIGPTSGIGYATGAGGTVTQITSKATAVTLSKVSGQITMNNAALLAGAVVSFTLTNTAIAATDTVSVNLKGGNATAATYRVHVEAIAAGSAIVVVTNISAGSLSEALVLNFNVVKGVNA